MTRRFFAFGCSFTAYGWPTWADLVGTHFPDNYYNYGRSGAGNFYIFQRFVHANIEHAINKDDLVIIQWSGTMREDRYLNKKWITPGGLWNYYPEDYIKKYADERGFLIRDLAAIAAVKTMLDNIGCEYHFISIGPIVNKNELWPEGIEGIEDLIDLHKDTLSIFKPSYIEILGTDYYPRIVGGGNIEVSDAHPVPGEHYKYLKHVLPNWLPNDVNLGERLDKLLAAIWHTNYKGWDYHWPLDRGFETIKKDL